MFLSKVGCFQAFLLNSLLFLHIGVLQSTAATMPFHHLGPVLILQELKISNFLYAISMRNRKIYLQVLEYGIH